MKNINILAPILCLIACGQQLVEFPLPTDLSSHSCGDINQQLDLLVSTDMLLTMDLVTDLQQPDMATADLTLMSDASTNPDLTITSGPLSACASMFGPAGQLFAVLGGSAVTNTGGTLVTGGDVGVSPGSSISGFPPALISEPFGISSLTQAAAAQLDLTKIYTCTQAAVCNTVLTGVDLGGMTLKPGVYCFSSSAQLTGNLVFDANGEPNAIWFVQIGSTLTVADASQMTVIGGGSPSNIYWQVGSSVTVGKACHIVGNMLSMASVTINTGSSVCGRALARTGAVTMDTNAVIVSACM